MKIKFSGNQKPHDEIMEKIITVGVDLVKHELNKETKMNFLVKPQTGMTFSNTRGNNAEFMTEMYDYCASFSPVLGNVSSMSNTAFISKRNDSQIDWNNKKNLQFAFNDSIFKQMYFAINTQILQIINSKNEVADIMSGCNIADVALGDSKTFEYTPNSLYKVQENGYGGLYSIYQETLRSSTTLLPKQKNASVSFNVMQMTPNGYNFATEMARLAKSFRVKMYTDVTNCLFTVANVSSTVFYNATFAKSTTMEMVDRIAAVNGGVPAAIYGSKLAVAGMSDNITTGYNIQDELVKTGYIDSPYGCPIHFFSQAVDTNSASYSFKVPNDRVIVMSAIGDKPVKLVREDSLAAELTSGKEGAFYNQVLTIYDSWIVGYVMSGVYGIIMI